MRYKDGWLCSILYLFVIVLDNNNSFCYGKISFSSMLKSARKLIGDNDETSKNIDEEALFKKNFKLLHRDPDQIYTPGSYMNTTELIATRGYTAEVYDVVTEDGYILTLTRIKTGKPSPYLPVLLQHGVLAASDQWVILGRNRGLAFMLADRGFDVWLGDQRGDIYSRRHVSYDPKESKFWDFSFHESGTYDLPAFITTILKKTESEELFYIGHSMGTLVYLVMASERPEFLKHIQLAVLLAPVCFPPQPSKSSIIRALLKHTGKIKAGLKKMNIREFLPRKRKIQAFIQRLCRPKLAINICLALIGNVYGDNKKSLDKRMVPLYFSSVPAGTSVRTMLHLTQIFKSGDFRQFDYGEIFNMFKYGQATAPKYDFNNMQAPIALMYGNNDGFLDRETVQKLSEVLPNVVLKYEVPDEKFNHLDFMFGLDATKLVYEPIINLLHIHNVTVTVVSIV